MKFRSFGISWGGPNDEWYWLTLFRAAKGHRHIGPCMDYYDGPLYTFGFWWFNLFWVLPWDWANPDWENRDLWYTDKKWLKK
jgi:hypothetical protein